MEQKEIAVEFPDGSIRKYPRGISLEGIAASISLSLKKQSVAGIVNGSLHDYSRSIEADAKVELFGLESPEGIGLMRHTAAHVLAQAVNRLYGDVHFGIGPVIENGFYYDLDMKEPLTVKDLAKIEKEMHKIIAENLELERLELSREQAKEMFSHDPLKLEILNDIPPEQVLTAYRQGEFADLCRGPHLPSTRYVKAFKLTHMSGAYWRGDSNNKMLQRIYGVAFASKEALEEHLHFVKEAKKRDHRKLGSELELFMFSEEAPGMPFYLANGQQIRNELESFLRELQQDRGYMEVRTPIMMDQKLWEQSGHWDHYKDNMYFSKVDHHDFALKPMNCPGHMLIFKDRLHSYKDLPIRMAEFGQVHRHEFSGALNGMLRVRSFCQDDAHIFVTPEQIEEEIAAALQLIDHVYHTFGFEYAIELSTRPDDYMGDEALWAQAEQSLKSVLDNMGRVYEINEGDGAFYGPKIDIHIKDALKRSHQCATVQLDFQMPEKFGLSYVNAHNEKVQPIVIHRAIFGSFDRFLGILIEHFGGAFPNWLAPLQATVIPVSNEVHGSYAQKVAERLKEDGIRVGMDLREEKLGYKVREAQMKKVPNIIVVGDLEMENGIVSVRHHGQKESKEMDVAAFSAKLKASILAKSLEKELS